MMTEMNKVKMKIVLMKLNKTTKKPLNGVAFFSGTVPTPVLFITSANKSVQPSNETISYNVANDVANLLNSIEG